ncbi:unnamed protein product [Sympodiomycopsis kandeliae]
MNPSTQYLVERVLQDVQFLGGQGYLQDNQISTIRAQLTPLLQGNGQTSPLPERNLNSTVNSFKDFTSHLGSSLPNAAAKQGKVPPPPPANAATAPKDQVKAQWAFEANGGPDELKFKEGDIIEIVERNDDNWWTGKLNGKQGLFPANYVEPYNEPQRNLPPAYGSAVASYDASSGKRVFAPAQARWTSGSSAIPSPSVNEKEQSQQHDTSSSSNLPHGLQPADPEEEKKKQEKIKKLGGRVGTAAASGVGFGLGAGLASRIF